MPILRHPLHRLLKSLAALVLLSVTVPAFADKPEPSAPNSGYSAQVSVTRLLKTGEDAAGRPLSYPTDAPAEITAVLVEMQPGAETGWHKHPFPCVGYILEGELHVTFKDGRVNILKAGDALA